MTDEMFWGMISMGYHALLTAGKGCGWYEMDTAVFNIISNYAFRRNFSCGNSSADSGWDLWNGTAFCMLMSGNSEN